MSNSIGPLTPSNIGAQYLVASTNLDTKQSTALAPPSSVSPASTTSLSPAALALRQVSDSPDRFAAGTSQSSVAADIQQGEVAAAAQVVSTATFAPSPSVQISRAVSAYTSANAQK